MLHETTFKTTFKATLPRQRYETIFNNMQYSGNNVAGFQITFKILQRVAAARCCVENRRFKSARVTSSLGNRLTW